MPKDVWDRINKAQGVQLEQWTERQLVSIDGYPLKIYGYAQAGILIEGTVYLATIVVESPLTSRAILA